MQSVRYMQKFIVVNRQRTLQLRTIFIGFVNHCFREYIIIVVVAIAGFLCPLCAAPMSYGQALHTTNLQLIIIHFII